VIPRGSSAAELINPAVVCIPLLVEFPPPKIQGITVGSFGSFASYTTHQNIKTQRLLHIDSIQFPQLSCSAAFLLVFFPSQFR